MSAKKINAAYRLFGSEEILSRLEALIAEKQGVLKEGYKEDGDIEFVHRMRVASRRLRRALSVFSGCFPKKSYNSWLLAVKKITGVLGGARDADVQIDFIRSIEKKTPEPSLNKGLERIVLRLSQKRLMYQRKIERSFAKIEASQTLEKMEASLKYSISKAKRENIDDHAPFVYKQAYDRITSLLTDMLTFEAYIYNPSLKEELHEMRKSTKFLRYEMEIFNNLFNGEIDEAISVVKKAQSYLGDIHDCDVWQDFLPNFIEEEKAFTQSYLGSLRGFKTLERGMLYLLKDRQKIRDELYSEFIEYWNKVRENAVFIKLRKVLEKYLPQEEKDKQNKGEEKPTQTKKTVNQQSVVKAEGTSTATRPTPKKTIATKKSVKKEVGNTVKKTPPKKTVSKKTMPKKTVKTTAKKSTTKTTVNKIE